MDTKNLERSIKSIIKTGSGYGPEFLPVLRAMKSVLKRINKGKPSAESYFKLGTLCLKLEDSLIAFDAFSAGYTLNKKHLECGTYCALLLEQQEKWHEALKIYKELNDADPENIHIAERMLFIFYLQKDIKQVLTICYYFLGKKLYYPSIYEYMSKFFYDSANLEKAIEYLRYALALDENNEDYKNRLIPYLLKNKDFKAVLAFDDYINKTITMPLSIKLVYANSLAGSGKLREARNYFVALLKNGAERYSVLAEIAHFHMNYEKNAGKGQFVNRYILKRQPDNVFALTNLALQSPTEFSIPAYEKVLKLCPDEPLFKMNYGHKLLSIGELDKAFDYYESRVEMSQPFLTDRLYYPENINNKKIFIWREQGIGDQFMWSWLFRFLVDDEIDATIHIEKRLVNIMRRSFPTLEFLGDDPIDVCYKVNFEEYDAQIITFSLGKYYIPQIKEAQNLFEKGEYRKSHLVADPNRMDYWKQKLKHSSGSKGNNKTVGICWRSGVVGDMRDYSYLSAENMVEIFKDLECNVVNLQYDYKEEEIALITASLGSRFINFTGIDLKNDQDDLAALMSNLDLIFSVGTAVLALAGSIGVSCLTPGGGTLGKSYNVMTPTVKNISGPKTMRENSKRFIDEIKAELSD